MMLAVSTCKSGQGKGSIHTNAIIYKYGNQQTAVSRPMKNEFRGEMDAPSDTKFRL